MPHILVIEHADGRADNIANLMQRNGLDAVLWRPYLDEPVPDLGPVVGVIVGGGPMGAYELGNHPFFRVEIPVLAQAMASVPVLAICLGCQIVAHLMDAPVQRTFWRRGWYETRILPEAVNDPLYSGLARTFPIFQYHQDEVLGVPTGAVLQMSSTGCMVEAFRLVDRPVWAVQGHPEIRQPKALKIFEITQERLIADNVDIELALQLGYFDGVINNDYLFANFAAVVREVSGSWLVPIDELALAEADRFLTFYERIAAQLTTLNAVYLRELNRIAASHLLVDSVRCDLWLRIMEDLTRAHLKVVA